MTGHFIGRVGTSPQFATASVQTLLGAAVYDPATQQSGATAAFGAALAAMTALDTTNLRCTFTAPSSGNVLVRLKASCIGGTGGGTNSWLFGVLESSTVIGRQAPIAGHPAPTTTARVCLQSEFAVTGVTAGSHSWDFAVATQQINAAATLAWGGPDDTSASTAAGAASIEVWDAANLLAVANYDPATIASKSLANALAMTALDTTNLRCTFTAPNSGRVRTIVRANSVTPSTSITYVPLLGVLESSTIVVRSVGLGGIAGAPAAGAAGAFATYEATQIVSGLSTGSHSYDAAYGVELGLASTNFKYGGPNDASGNDAAGMLRFEIWAA